MGEMAMEVTDRDPQFTRLACHHHNHPQPERNRAARNTRLQPKHYLAVWNTHLQPERNRAVWNTTCNPSATLPHRIPAHNPSATVPLDICTLNALHTCFKNHPPEPNPPRNARKNALFLGHWCQGSNVQNGVMGHPTNFSIPPAADADGPDMSKRPPLAQLSGTQKQP
ncbi:hypothetical protein B0H14DRAFT_2587654 [Mycena olivaceomarginata]|nr:hypothetical protein B0H14DRAFT_2587654 [Mycena olivaceomarginata]